MTISCATKIAAMAETPAGGKSRESPSIQDIPGARNPQRISP